MLTILHSTKSLTEYDRQKLRMILLGLNVFQIIFAICGFSLGAYISLSVNRKANLIKGFSVKSIGGTVSGCSIVLFLLHCLGVKASNDCGCLKKCHRFKNKLLILLLGYVVMSAALLAIAVFCAVQYFKLKEALGSGLIHSMHLYSKNKNKKRELDEIQMEYRCCGNSNYTDWFKIKWMPESSLPFEEDQMFSLRDYLHSVPFSCCDPSQPPPCFHRLVTEQRGNNEFVSHSFFKRGCTVALLEVLQEVIQGTAILIVIPFLLELIIAIETRYLQTSIDDSRKRNNPDRVCDCWLFKRFQDESNIQSEDVDEREFSGPYTSSDESIIYTPSRTKIYIKERKDKKRKTGR